ncbi:MAG: VTT domain-containing protein [Dehalococcoidia bacterium]
MRPREEIAATSQVAEAKKGFWTREKYLALLVITAVFAISFVLFILGREITPKDVGYLGVFLATLLGNATIILPLPAGAAVIAGGALLSPILVALVGGVGATLGELTGYGAGYGGKAIFEKRDIYRKIEGWMHAHGTIVLFVLSIIPNPFFDIAGLAAGSVRFPLWRFFLVVWAGKTIQYTGVAFAGAWGSGQVIEWLERIVG